MSIESLKAAREILENESLSAFEIIPLNEPVSFHHYQDWLAQGHHGAMSYMEENQKVRQSPTTEFKEMKSIIVFEQDYFREAPNSPFSSLQVARYAQSDDYHIWFREKLNKLIAALQERFPEESFLSFTDSVPLLERDYGQQAGLGWIGKNTCLIHPKRGSFFFIGEILTSLSSEARPKPMHDFCGSCTACMDQCPTDAFSSPRVLDATRCISYWNIESKTVPPVELRSKMGEWFFGCDICQTVCPWNIKVHQLRSHKTSRPDREKQKKELCFILQNSNKKLLKITKDSPLSRAGGRGLKRNALIVVGNAKFTELRSIVETYLDHPQLAELAEWTIEQLAKK